MSNELSTIPRPEPPNSGSERIPGLVKIWNFELDEVLASAIFCKPGRTHACVVTSECSARLEGHWQQFNAQLAECLEVSVTTTYVLCVLARMPSVLHSAVITRVDVSARASLLRYESNQKGVRNRVY